MKKGKEVITVSMPRLSGKNYYYTLLDELRLVKLVPKTEVIFNPPVTIFYMNGKKYVSKAHEEEFDEEKGLLMCLAKANGITHLELKRMLKKAKRFNGKEDEDGRKEIK